MKVKRKLAMIIILAVVAVAVIAAVMTAGTYSWLTFSQTSASNVIKSGTIDFDVEECGCSGGDTCECGCDDCGCSTGGTCDCYVIKNTGTMELAFTVVEVVTENGEETETAATFTVCGGGDSITLGQTSGYYRLGVDDEACFCLTMESDVSYAVVAYNIIETGTNSYSSGGFKVKNSLPDNSGGLSRERP